MARSRFSSEGSSRTYDDVERKGGSSFDKSLGLRDSQSQSSHNGGGSHVELVPVLPAYIGKSHGVYEAKQNGLPDTHADAYTSRPKRETRRERDSVHGVPIQGIQVRHEVKIEQDGDRPYQV